MYYEVTNVHPNDQVLPLTSGNALIKAGKKGVFKSADLTERDMKMILGCRMSVNAIPEKGEEGVAHAVRSQSSSIVEAARTTDAADQREQASSSDEDGEKKVRRSGLRG